MPNLRKFMRDVTILLAVFGLLVVIMVAFSGCASINRQLDTLPAGSAEEVTYTRTGKFSSTQIHVEGWLKDGTQASADVLTVQHSNAWIPNLSFTARGYRRLREGQTPSAPVIQTPPPEPIAAPAAADPEPSSPPAAPSAPNAASGAAPVARRGPVVPPATRGYY